MGMNHDEVIPELKELDKVIQSMLWLDGHMYDKPICHWLWHYLYDRKKELCRIDREEIEKNPIEWRDPMHIRYGEEK